MFLLLFYYRHITPFTMPSLSYDHCDQGATVSACVCFDILMFSCNALQWLRYYVLSTYITLPDNSFCVCNYTLSLSHLMDIKSPCLLSSYVYPVKEKLLLCCELHFLAIHTFCVAAVGYRKYIEYRRARYLTVRICIPMLHSVRGR